MTAKHGLNRNNNSHAKVDGESQKMHEPYIRNSQLRNAETGRNSLPQGKTKYLVVQYQCLVLKAYIQGTL